MDANEKFETFENFHISFVHAITTVMFYIFFSDATGGKYEVFLKICIPLFAISAALKYTISHKIMQYWYVCFSAIVFTFIQILLENSLLSILLDPDLGNNSFNISSFPPNEYRTTEKQSWNAAQATLCLFLIMYLDLYYIIMAPLAMVAMATNTVFGMFSCFRNNTEFEADGGEEEIPKDLIIPTRRPSQLEDLKPAQPPVIEKSIENVEEGEIPVSPSRLFEKQYEERMKCPVCVDKPKSKRCKSCFNGFCEECVEHITHMENPQCPSCQATLKTEKLVLCRV